MGGEILGWVHSLRRYDLLRSISASVLLTLYRAVCTFCPHTEGRTNTQRLEEMMHIASVNISRNSGVLLNKRILPERTAV